jgi:hypothetical protein
MELPPPRGTKASAANPTPESLPAAVHPVVRKVDEVPAELRAQLTPVPTSPKRSSGTRALRYIAIGSASAAAVAASVWLFGEVAALAALAIVFLGPPLLFLGWIAAGVVRSRRP